MEEAALKEVPARLSSQLVREAGASLTSKDPDTYRYTHRQLAAMIIQARDRHQAFTVLQQARAVELKRRRIYVRGHRSPKEGRSPRTAPDAPKW